MVQSSAMARASDTPNASAGPGERDGFDSLVGPAGFRPLKGLTGRIVRADCELDGGPAIHGRHDSVIDRDVAAQYSANAGLRHLHPSVLLVPVVEVGVVVDGTVHEVVELCIADPELTAEVLAVSPQLILLVQRLAEQFQGALPGDAPDAIRLDKCGRRLS